MSLDQPKVLIVEDEPAQVEILRYNLKSQNYEVVVATDGETGVEKARDELPDVILMDWMLPRLSGIEACRQIRRIAATRQIPIIMLTARSEERDRVRGLDIGADDYISKPYSIKELLARVRAALRRPAALVTGEVLEFGKIKIDLSKHIITIADKPIHLGPTEYRLLITLMKSPERVFSRDQLLDMVWGLSSDVDTRTVDVHIGRLRRLLTENRAKNMIRTVRGYGYSVQGS
ncbi:MAG: phosphate regulon transcriptional regulatory protein PhoB [Alphaproteobacteria bacterium]|nr:phosphate regulon transcriptional regulatory protein PhoB [Alphaproteobacteria bacterium]